MRNLGATLLDDQITSLFKETIRNCDLEDFFLIMFPTHTNTHLLRYASDHNTSAGVKNFVGVAAESNIVRW